MLGDNIKLHIKMPDGWELSFLGTEESFYNVLACIMDEEHIKRTICTPENISGVKKKGE